MTASFDHTARVWEVASGRAVALLKGHDGTRMPSVFTDGKSSVTKIYDGHGAEQAEAMWGYLALGNNLPLLTFSQQSQGNDNCDHDER